MSTHQKADGAMYAPKGKANIVCGPGEFRSAAIGLDHGHIYGMGNGPTEAGGRFRFTAGCAIAGASFGQRPVALHGKGIPNRK